MSRLPFLFYFLSGATALVYETVWIRLFSATFGNTAQALSTVIAVFLGGLAAGSILSARFKTRGLRVYGAIEAAVGVYALATPGLIRAAQPMLASVYQSNAAMLPVARAGLCALILLPATILMGATLPVLDRWLHSSGRTSWIYALNVAGACCGALATGFLLLPGLGYQGTLLGAGMVNAAIGALCLLPIREAPQQAAPSVPGQSEAARWLGVLAFLSGWITLSGEVAWTRLMGLLFGFTASTLTLVLAVFLAGLAGGAIIASYVRKNVWGWLGGAQFASLALLVAGAFLAAHSSGWIAEAVRAHSSSAEQIELAKLQLLAFTVLPLALALGLTFPLLIRAGGRSVGQPGQNGRLVQARSQRAIDRVDQQHSRFLARVVAALEDRQRRHVSVCQAQPAQHGGAQRVGRMVQRQAQVGDSQHGVGRLRAAVRSSACHAKRRPGPEASGRRGGGQGSAAATASAPMAERLSRPCAGACPGFSCCGCAIRAPG